LEESTVSALTGGI